MDAIRVQCLFPIAAYIVPYGSVPARNLTENSKLCYQAGNGKELIIDDV